MPPDLNTTTLVEKEFEENVEKKFVSELEREKYRFFIWEFETEVIWPNVIVLGLFHILTVYTLITHPYFEKPGIVLYACIVAVIGGFGITAGVHRYFSHRSYKVKWPLKLILLFCFSITGQYSLKEWVRDHRLHHKYTDTDADPHNSRRGFFFAHIGWLMMKKHPEVFKKAPQIDYSDLFDDPLIVFHQRHFTWFKLFFCFTLPTIIPPLAWGESWTTSIMVNAISRTILALHCTLSVNSVAHMWGNKPYDKNIYPVDNTGIGILTLGDGYHNYHHTFPWDYRAAEIGTFLNVTTFFLNIFEKIGWAYDMRTTSPELIRKVVLKKGDGSHYKWGHEITEEKAKAILNDS